MTSAGAAAVAIGRIRSEGGIAQARALSPVVSVLVVGAAWSAALLARFAPESGPLGWIADNRRAAEVVAAAASTLVLLAATDWTLRRRRLELGVEERALAMRGILAACLVLAVVAGFLDPTQAARIGRAFVAATASLLGAAALHADAVKVARFTRRALCLLGVGGAAAWLGAPVAANSFERAWLATAATVLAGLLIGAGVSIWDRPLRPAGGIWLDAFARARAAASSGDADVALRDALVALRAPAGAGGASPELWTTAPPRVATVDAAGYLHEREGDLPDMLASVAADEPEGTLRSELLDSLEVRRPDLRPLAGWLSARGGWLATVIASEGEIDGVLVLPHEGCEPPTTLEELRALRVVADGLAAPCRTRAMQARLLTRAHESLLRAEAAESALQRLRHERALDAGRDAIVVERLARDASVGVYAASSRMAIEAIERRASVNAPIALVVPSGVDAVPYLARAHASGPRRVAPLVFVDGASAAEHEVGRWRDASRSPLALAHGGTLVLLDGASLATPVQQLVARALTERRTPWERCEPLDIQLVFTAAAPPDELVASGRLDSSLAQRLGDALACPVALPRLRDRPEDLRALVNDRLARDGLRVHGRPVGIEPSAYARLVEHPFPGEDAELAVIVRSLVGRCKGDVVRVEDVEASVPQARRSPQAQPEGTREDGRLSGAAEAPADRRGGRGGSRRRSEAGPTKGSPRGT
ncbi:MAG: hypothetical protein M3O50_10275 [Myxococcota bacterium]|nr:hypothetical protein [Myxococcota bacterium]